MNDETKVKFPSGNFGGDPTIIRNPQMSNLNGSSQGQKNSIVPYVVGGVSGAVLGAGAMYVYGANKDSEVPVDYLDYDPDNFVDDYGSSRDGDIPVVINGEAGESEDDVPIIIDGEGGSQSSGNNITINGDVNIYIGDNGNIGNGGGSGNSSNNGGGSNNSGEINGGHGGNGDIDFATLDDGLSFSEAFAEARRQVGAGGAFTWRGTVYGTFYESEWNSMSPSEQRQFTLDAINEWNEFSPEEQLAMGSDSLSGNVPQPPAHNEEEEEWIANSNNNNDIPSDDIPTGEVVVFDPEEEDIPDSGNQSSVVVIDSGEDYVVLSDGEDTMGFVDIDNNGTVDVVLIDSDGDGVLTENDAIVTADEVGMEGVTIEDVNLIGSDPIADYEADPNDYINDAIV